MCHLKVIAFLILVGLSGVSLGELTIVEEEPRISMEFEGTLEEVEKTLVDYSKEKPPRGIGWCNQIPSMEGKNIIIRTRVNVPVWKERNSPDTSKEDKEKWDAFYKRVWDHEHVHARDARLFMTACHEAIQGIESANERLKTFNKYIDYLDQANKNFDMNYEFVYPSGVKGQKWKDKK